VFHFEIQHVKGNNMLEQNTSGTNNNDDAPSDKVVNTNSSSKFTVSYCSSLSNCVECLTPSATVYRKFSSSSVKLTRCIVCRKDVDPYVEREFFLVFLDILLHRIVANRHLYLCHHHHPGSSPATNTIDMLNWMQQTLLLAVLDTYLKYQAMENSNISNTLLTFLFLSSVVEHLTLVAVIATLSYFMLLVLANQHRGQEHQLAYSKLFLFRGVTLPAIYMKLLVSIIIIWENSFAVRALGALLIISQQFLSFFCILEYKVAMIMFLQFIEQQEQQQADTATTRTKEVEDLSYWVKFYQRINAEQRGFTSNNSGTLIACSLIAVASSVAVRSCVSFLISDFFREVPVSIWDLPGIF